MGARLVVGDVLEVIPHHDYLAVALRRSLAVLQRRPLTLS